MLKALAHVCIGATDLAATERFYCSGLGLEKVFNFIRAGEVVGFYLRAAESNFVEVFLQDEVDVNARCPIRHFCLEVKDIEEARGQLAAYGYDATAKALGGDASWQCWVTDPSGVRIELHQYTEKSCQITGRDCVLD